MGKLWPSYKYLTNQVAACTEIRRLPTHIFTTCTSAVGGQIGNLLYIKNSVT